MSHILFKTANLSKLLQPFLEKRKSGRDVVARTMLLVPREDFVELFSTDGVAYLRARVPAEVENVEKPLVFDMASLNSVLRTGAEDTRLFLEDGHLYADFFRGRIFLQTYSFQASLFQGKLPKTPMGAGMVNTSDYQNAMEALHRITETADNPDFCYLFLTPNGAFSTNGSLVAKVDGPFLDCTLRQRDTTVLSMVLNLHPLETFEIVTYKDMVMVKTKFLDYVFPKVEKHLPDSYQGKTGQLPDCFLSKTSSVKSIMSICNAMPDSSGLVSLSFGDWLEGETRTRKGFTSTFQISNAIEGNPLRKKTQILIKTMLLALSVFQKDPDLSLGIREDGSLLLWAGGKSLSFISRHSL